MGALVANALVASRFRLVRKLGEGGMGVVWSAVDERDTTPVALKFMRVEGAGSPDSLRRFQREAKTAMRLSHPNVVHVREVVETDDGQPAMVMDLLEGESLAAKLGREQALQVPEFARIFVQILSAVGSAHAAGIVHRDLKPDNVFLVQGEDVRVLDFGIAKFRSPDGESAATTALTGTGAMLGTPFYMAPEQVFGERDLDHRADVWALGVIMYECLAGKRPFAGENFGQVFKAVTRGELVPLLKLAPRLPRDLAETCERMLAVDRDKRLSDLREVFEIVRRYTDVEAQIFSAPTLPEGSDREQYADALAPTLAADTGSALARTGKGSAFPASRATPRRWPYVVVAALVACGIGGTALFLRRAPAPPLVPAIPVVAAPRPIAATPPSIAATPVLSAPKVVDPKVEPQPSASVATKPIVKQKPIALPPPSIAASTIPTAVPSLAGGVAPKPPF